MYDLIPLPLVEFDPVIKHPNCFSSLLRNDLHSVQHLGSFLDDPLAINAKRGDGARALNLAAALGHVEVVEPLDAAHGMGVDQTRLNNIRLWNVFQILEV